MKSWLEAGQNVLWAAFFLPKSLRDWSDWAGLETDKLSDCSFQNLSWIQSSYHYLRSSLSVSVCELGRNFLNKPALSPRQYWPCLAWTQQTFWSFMTKLDWFPCGWVKYQHRIGRWNKLPLCNPHTHKSININKIFPRVTSFFITMSDVICYADDTLLYITATPVLSFY